MPDTGAAQVFLTAKHQPRIMGYLDRLGNDPPLVLSLEGGLEAERRDLALYWSARLNCQSSPAPCGQCRLCQQIAQGIFRDLVFFDGQFEKIKIGPVREMRQGLAQSPEYAGRRVVVLHEAQNLTPEAANALLKSLEEPPPDNVFILTTPQREWLLPTLISRSWTLTLDWPVQDPNNPKLAQEWLPRLAFFWKNSRGLFEYSGQKSSLSPPVLNAILAVCQRELLSAMTQSEPDSELARLFKSGLAPKHLPLIDQIIHKALEAQRCQVNPALILDWFALQVWKQLKDLPSGRT